MNSFIERLRNVMNAYEQATLANKVIILKSIHDIVFDERKRLERDVPQAFDDTLIMLSNKQGLCVCEVSPCVCWDE